MEQGSHHSPPLRRWIFIALVLVALVLGYRAASELRWTCDDVFISLRYASNFLDGKGLVYNQGERVEGYTHFLWLMILVLCRRLGLDPQGAALNLGLVSYLGLIMLLALVSLRIAPRRTGVIIPFASLALALHYDAAVWATGGLETFFYALLIVLGFTTYFFTSIRRRRKLVLTGLLVALVVLTRPDAVLIAALAILFLLGRAFLMGFGPRAWAEELGLFSLPLILILAPYAAWKVAYYGDILPNTYYAKSAGSSYYSQGFYYLWTYFRCYVTSWLFLLAIPAGLRLFIAESPAEPGAWRARVLSALRREHLGAIVFAFTAVVCYLVFFIARVGGDFMYARFLVPALPLLYLLIEWSVPRLHARVIRAAPVVFLIVLSLVATVERGNRGRFLLKEQDGKLAVLEHRGILDERFYYTHTVLIDEQRRMGEALAPYFEGLDVTVLLRGQACLGYYAGFKTCIENNGLTDAHIARQPLERRGRVGHEKIASYDYLIQRGTDFVFRRTPYRDKSYRMAVFTLPGDLQDWAEILTYHPAILGELKRRLGENFHFIPFGPYLDAYIRTELPTRPIAAVQEDYREFREYYFHHNRDPERERAFLARLSGEGIPRDSNP